MKRVFQLIAIVVIGVLICGSAFAQQPDTAKPAAAKKQAASTSSEKPAESSIKPEAALEQKPAPQTSGDKEKDKEEHYDMTEVPPVVTHHQITVDGKMLKYTATAGRLPIKRGDGKIEAEMFYVAYTLDGQDAAKRPLTFAFNGGPGSASIWLHMGALGPRKVVLQPDGFMPPAPYRMEDNPYTLLDKSDLVLIDAIGTGFSRAADAETHQEILGREGRHRGLQRIHSSLHHPQRALDVAAVYCSEKATARRARPASPDISPIAAFRSTASRCSRRC